MVRLDRTTARGICVKAIYGIHTAMSRPAVCSRVHRHQLTVWIHHRHVSDHQQRIQVVAEVST